VLLAEDKGRFWRWYRSDTPDEEGISHLESSTSQVSDLQKIENKRRSEMGRVLSTIEKFPSGFRYPALQGLSVTWQPDLFAMLAPRGNICLVKNVFTVTRFRHGDVPGALF
jgi:hypothetical protein